MPTVERDISIGEAGDVSIGDLQPGVAYHAFWKAHERLREILVGTEK
jgi:hypothetical protein